MTLGTAGDRRRSEVAAAHHAAYRRTYPDELIDRLVERFDLTSGGCVLDLGCGTGRLAIPLARLGARVIAVDPDIEMLRAGIRSEAVHGARGIAWMRGDDRSLDRLPLPQLTVCTMGPSFDRIDRGRTLAVLDHLVERGGGVAVVAGATADWPVTGPAGEPWMEVLRETVREMAGPTAAPPDADEDDREGALARSPFFLVDRWTFDLVERFTIDQVVGLQLAAAWSAARGRTEAGAAHDLATALTARLYDVAPSGVLDLPATFELLVATR